MPHTIMIFDGNDEEHQEELETCLKVLKDIKKGKYK